MSQFDTKTMAEALEAAKQLYWQAFKKGDETLEDVLAYPGSNVAIAEIAVALFNEENEPAEP